MGEWRFLIVVFLVAEILRRFRRRRDEWRAILNGLFVLVIEMQLCLISEQLFSKEIYERPEGRNIPLV